MIPAVWIQLPALPLNPNGKLDQKVSATARQIWMPGQEFQAPTTPTEQILAGLWGGILSRDSRREDMIIFSSSGDILFSRRKQLPGAIKYFAWKRRSVRCSMPRQSPVSRLTSMSPAASGSPLRHRLFRLRAYRSSAAFTCSATAVVHAAIRSGQSALSLAVAVRIAGPFDANVLEASLNAIVRRHESLRTVFHEEWGELRQEILSELPVKLELIVVQSDSMEDVHERATEPDAGVRCGPIRSYEWPANQGDALSPASGSNRALPRFARYSSVSITSSSTAGLSDCF